LLQPGDLLVLNNSRVIPARLRGTNARTGGRFEVLLVEENAPNDWWVMLRPGKRARVGTQLVFHDRDGKPAAVRATVRAFNAAGLRRLWFGGTDNILGELEALGETPLPPYIQRAHDTAEDRERYQTVYAQPPGSVAAPTAGLHFTTALLDAIRARGARVRFVTLHVGLGTFAPVKSDTVEQHAMHAERFELGEATAQAIRETKRAGGRVIAVGTTVVRVLESVAAQTDGPLRATRGLTRFFIYPPFAFKVVDALLTNFHLPQSTLLMLVSAFAAPGGIRGRELVLAAYAEAIRHRYRFFSYGDAMLIE
jgi:S-adenosylmethionine:tRNA ribosyltransferase-isomerase